MTSLKIALLAAAAITIAPTVAHAQDETPRHQRADRGTDDAPPPPPRASNTGALFRAPPPRPAPSAAAPAPRGNWGGGQQAIQPAPPRADPQFSQPRGDRGERGGWGGRGAWRGEPRDGGQPAVQAPVQAPQQRPERADWQERRQAGGNGAWQGDRTSPRPAPPQGVTGGQDWRNRGEWRGGDNPPNRDADRRGDDRRGNDHRGDRDDHRWDGANRGQWDDGNRANRTNRGPWPNSGQWDNRNRSQRNGSDHRGVWSGNGHRWDADRWRNDNRYDWRSWRDTHHDRFRWHYSAPRGYHYRSVYRGFFLEPFFYGSSYWLEDPYEYRLPPVEWPLRWVRYYDDALLVDVTSGEVLDVIQGFFF